MYYGVVLMAQRVSENARRVFGKAVGSTHRARRVLGGGVVARVRCKLVTPRVECGVKKIMS